VGLDIATHGLRGHAFAYASDEVARTPHGAIVEVAPKVRETPDEVAAAQALELSHCRPHGLLRRDLNVQMHVVFIDLDCQDGHLVLLGDPPQQSLAIVPLLFPTERPPPPLGRPDQVVPAIEDGVTAPTEHPPTLPPFGRQPRVWAERGTSSPPSDPPRQGWLISPGQAPGVYAMGTKLPGSRGRPTAAGPTGVERGARIGSYRERPERNAGRPEAVPEEYRRAWRVLASLEAAHAP